MAQNTGTCFMWCNYSFVGSWRACRLASSCAIGRSQSPVLTTMMTHSPVTCSPTRFPHGIRRSFTASFGQAGLAKDRLVRPHASPRSPSFLSRRLLPPPPPARCSRLPSRPGPLVLLALQS